MITFDDLNHCSMEGFVEALAGLYEHSPWIAEHAASSRPFANFTALKRALRDSVHAASDAEQLALVCAYSDLMADDGAVSPMKLHSRQRAPSLIDVARRYAARFAFPCVLAVDGPAGPSMPVAEIVATIERRLRNLRDDELQENLRQVHRIAELRLNHRFDLKLHFGDQVMAWSEDLAKWSEEEEALTCTYMTPSHRASAQALLGWMKQSGMDAHIDAVGNVVGRYAAAIGAGASAGSGYCTADTPVLLTGSHYDTVRNGGKYDGRVGILLPIAVIADLHRRGERLPFHLDVVGFAEEEGVRYKTAFLGSSALTGRFDPTWLDRLDTDGISLATVLRDAGTNMTQIGGASRRGTPLIGYIEWHIEQGPVLLRRGTPVGIVTAIAGSKRYWVDLKGVASHAGTTPMTMRRDAAAAAAEITLLIEARCATAPALVGTVGQINVPNGSLNVVPGVCRMSIDIRADDDETRDAAVDDVMSGIAAICDRRGIRFEVELVQESTTTQCAPWMREHIAAAVFAAGCEIFSLPSGAGHDAVEISQLTDVAMLFVRCGNGGISHNPLETVTADDIDLSARIFANVLKRIAYPARDDTRAIEKTSKEER